jgi:hypothetical protein
MRTEWALLLSVGCGFSSSTELATDAARRDGAVQSDAPGTGTDAPTTSARCYATGSPFEVCLGEIPTGDVTLTVTIDTTPGALGSPCLGAQPLGWTTRQPAACFVVAANITVATTRVTGTRPLVLLADAAITIETLLDVSSHVGGDSGPGLDGTGCLPHDAAAANGTDGAGGGAGGSFTTRGGNGGVGDNNKKAGGRAAAAVSGPFDRLRAGCDGQGGSSTQLAGAPGPGGGVVYLVAGGMIENTGAINASGAGGAGGGTKAGGSGGGSGGMIVLHAAAIVNGMGVLMANGGGGAGGGTGSPGSAGEDPSDALIRAAGGTTGGDGGFGYADDVNASSGTNGASHDGGGGGGGGAGYIRANVAVVMGDTSPGAAVIP